MEDVQPGGGGSTSGSQTPLKESGRPSSRTQLHPQEILTHVCRRWRAIALDMPTLWTYIDFLDGPPFNRSREWIRRTKGRPLDIVLACTHVDGLFMNDQEVSTLKDSDSDEFTVSGASFSSYKSGQIDSLDMHTILNIILPHLSHWGSFTFISDDLNVAKETLSALSAAGEAPELTAMLLSYFWNPMADTVGTLDPLYSPFGGRTPKLRQLQLTMINLDWSLPFFLQGDYMASLTFRSWRFTTRHGPTIHDFTRVLQGCSHLTHLELSNFGPRGEASRWPSQLVVELPSLKWLSLSRLGNLYLASLLLHFRFPNLHMLVVNFASQDSGVATAALCDVVSLRSLTGLHIEGMRVTDRDTAGRLWTGLESLVALHIDRTTMIGSSFQRFWKQTEYFTHVDSLVVSGLDSDGDGLQSLVDARQDSLSLRRLDNGDFVMTRKREVM